MFSKFLKKFTDKPVQGETQGHCSQESLPLTVLQKLIPIGELPAGELEALQPTVCRFDLGEIIFNRGEFADSVIYLYTGEVYLDDNNGKHYSIEAETLKACYPLSTNALHRFSAIAMSPATSVIYLPLSLIRHSSETALANKKLINLSEIPAELRESDFFSRIYGAFNRKAEWHLPSLPDVALRLRRALQKDISVNDAVKIINMDPAISSKLIQIVNAPIYRTSNPMTNCHDAVLRLGLKTTQNLVTSLCMADLFYSRNKRLNERMRQTWKQSIDVASLSYALALLGKKFNADEALLAGLTHNIGALPIIAYAETLDAAQYTDEELDQTIALLQGPFGAAVLNKWHFPDIIQNIPLQSSNWYHDEHAQLQLSDIVVLAKFHSLLGKADTQNLPPLNTLPAFLKLGDDSPLTPSMSLQILQDAKQQIDEALSFFRS